MNIVLVNHYAGGPDHGMEFRPHQLARHWVADGHDVTILAGSWSHLRHRNPQVPERVLEERIDGIRHRWLRTPRYEGNGLGRIRSIHAFLRAVDRERRTFLADRDIDAVIASSTYPFDIDPCRRIARDHDALLVWEVHDLWPLSPIELSGYSPRHPFIRVTQRAEDRCCRDADLVVSILPRAIDHLRTRGLDESRYLAIPNGAAPVEPSGSAESTPSAARDRIAAHRAAGRFTLAYAGTHGEHHGLDTLLDAMARLDRTRFAAVFLGEGPEKVALQRTAAAHGLTHVDFLDRVPRADAIAAMAAADASFAGLRGHPLYRFGIGLNKIFDGMLAARPIVGSYTAGNDPITEAACGVRVEADDAAALARAIESLAATPPADRDAMGRRGAAFVAANHDHAVLARRFVNAIERRRAESGARPGTRTGTKPRATTG